MSEADIPRAAMGKKDKPKMAKLRTKFIAGPLSGRSPSTADALFDGIAKFAEYGFNCAHSAAYGVIAYQTAYRRQLPAQYMTSLLIHMEGCGQGGDGHRGLPDQGHRVLPPDINRRGGLLDGESRLFGLAAIKNVGQHAVESIVELRKSEGPFTTLDDLCERTTAIQDVNRRVLEALVQSGACDSLGERNRLMATLDHAVSRAERARRDRESGQTSLLDMVGSPESPAEDYGLLIDIAPMAGEEKLRLEKELLGLYLSDHPLRRISAELAKLSDTQAVEVTSALQDTEVRVAGLVREVRRVVTRKGQIMAYAQLEDLTGSVDVVLFPRVFEQTRLLFEPDKVVVVQGRVDARADHGRRVGSPGRAELEPRWRWPRWWPEMAWLWDDPECVPMARQIVHVRSRTTTTAWQSGWKACWPAPGTDEVVLHVVVGSREVTVHADRYHVRPVRRWQPTSTSWLARRRRGWRRSGRKRSQMETAADAASRAGSRRDRGVEMSEEEKEGARGRYVVVKALEDGVVIMGLTRGKDTRSHHSERLDEGEVLVAQFTELTAAIKIRGKAEILTDVGKVESGS
jgi:hypothetical protein